MFLTYLIFCLILRHLNCCHPVLSCNDNLCGKVIHIYDVIKNPQSEEQGSHLKYETMKLIEHEKQIIFICLETDRLVK